MFDKESINRIKENIDIVDIVREFVPTLKSVGKDYKALSPFSNEKTPSFYVSRDKQFFKDFSSGKGGDVIKFVQEFHNMTFNESVQFLADKLGIDLVKSKVSTQEFDKIDELRKSLSFASDYYYNKLLQDNSKASKYLYDRGINQNSIENFQIGYAPETWNELYDKLKTNGFQDEILIEAGLVKNKNNKIYDAYRDRLIFPIKDDLGRTIGLGGRIFEKSETSAKYINSPQNRIYDKSKVLYGLFEAKREINNQNSAILVEGYFDVISLHQEGIKNVIASSGTALSQFQLRTIARHTKNLFIIYDADKAGQTAANRVMDIALEEGMEIKLVSLPEGEDPDSIIKNYGRNTFNKYLREAIDFIQFKISTFGKRDNPSKEAELIRSLINSVKKIPDRLQHDLYIKKIAEYLKLSEIQIANVYLEKVKEEKNDVVKEEIKLKVNNNLIHETKNEYLSNINDLDEAERIIFKYLIDNFEDIHSLVEEFDLSEDIFLTELSLNVYITLINCEGHNLFEYLIENEEVQITTKEVIESISFNFSNINIPLAESKKIKYEVSKNTIFQSILSLKINKLIKLDEKEIIEDEEIDNETMIQKVEIRNKIRKLEEERLTYIND